jgi:hypothetical protein
MRIRHSENAVAAQLLRRDLESAFLNLFFHAAGRGTSARICPSVVPPEAPLARTGQECAAQ